MASSSSPVSTRPELTRRERQIVELLIEGCANKEIASRLGVSAQTVKNQLSTLYQKTGVGGRLELVVLMLGKETFGDQRGPK
jgi:DNA-binding NarL/FixJ family response regulator